MSKNAKRWREIIEKKNKAEWEKIPPEEREIIALANEIHKEKFPEEYDFMYDSIVDANERERGINPMSEEYQKEISARRESLGVSPLTENGYADSKDSMQLCIDEAKEIIFGHNIIKSETTE